MDSKTIYVYEEFSNEIPLLLGTLFVQYLRGEEVFSFEYDETWLKTTKNMFCLDPSLEFYGGKQYLKDGKKQFGIFMDSSPDRWGRMLMNRRAAISGDNKHLQELDYLLGVDDFSRMGAIRFSLEKNGTFVSQDKETSTPPMTKLRDLEYASSEYEKDENSLNGKWVKLLLAPGSSLGGARPKANVLDVNGELWIAKFPSKSDEYDMGAWEYACHELAKLCGVNVPEAKLLRFSNRGSTFLTKRFDRNNDKRIHYASAMTMLEKNDGESEQSSYLDIVDFIKSNSTNPKEDLLQLYKRVAFNIAISNTDDHLRNHGFILNNNGWRLSPAFDMNPNPDGTHLSLKIDRYSSELSFKQLLDSHSYYGIKKEEALSIINITKQTISDNYEKIARKCNISKASIEYMKRSFNV